MIYFLLFALYILNVASDEEFSLDDNVDENNWNGMVVLVLSDENDEPEIVLASDLNRYSQVYCLTLEEMFEATFYNTIYNDSEYGKHDEVDDSEIDFQNDVTWTYAKGADNKSFSIEGVPTDASLAGVEYSEFTSMRFVFAVTTSPVDATQYGLEYTFELFGYSWMSAAADAKLVLVFEFKQCDEEFDSVDFSSDGDGDGDSDSDAADGDETDGRRRLGDDDGDESVSDDGISSDDSDELDIGSAQFINHGTANCVGDATLIPTDIAYGGEVSDDELHVVFDHFDCADIIQDPYVGQDTSKLLYDSAIRYSANMIILVVIGMMVFIF